MEERIQRRYYEKLTEFVADMTKIFDNCRYYNPSDSPFYQCAEVLESFFVQKLKGFKASRWADAASVLDWFSSSHSTVLRPVKSVVNLNLKIKNALKYTHIHTQTRQVRLALWYTAKDKRTDSVMRNCWFCDLLRISHFKKF